MGYLKFGLFAEVPEYMNWILEVLTVQECPLLALLNKDLGKPPGVYSLMMQNLKALHVSGCIFVLKVARYSIKY